MSELNPDKLFYSIKEVSAHFEIASSVLRYWESEFKELNPRRTKKGNRQYTKADVEIIRKIYHLLKNKGYTIQGAKESLKAQGKVVDKEAQIADSLKKIKGFLLDLKAQLD